MTSAVCRLIVCLLPLAPGLAACDGGNDSHAPVVEKHGHVTFVRNGSGPAFADSVVVFKRIWSYPGEGGVASAEWQLPTSVRLGDSTIYVLDPMSSRVHVLELSGEYIGGIGREGSGPAEISRPIGIAVVDSTLVVVNGGTARLELFSSEGDYIRSITLGSLTFDVVGLQAELLLLQSVNDQLIWRRQSLQDDNSLPFKWHGAGIADSILQSCARVRGSNGGIAVVDCYRPVVIRADESGEVIRVVEIARPPQEASAADLAAFRRLAEAEIREVGYSPERTAIVVDQQVEAQRWLRSFRSAVSNSHVTFLWEQKPQELGGGNAVLHILGENGSYLFNAATGDRWIDFDVSGCMLYALTEDGLSGLVHLVAYRADVPRNVERLC